MIDEAEALGVDCVEIPFFTTALIARGTLIEPSVKRFAAKLQGRRLAYSAHANLGINLMDARDRTALHETVARANIELAARIAAMTGWPF